MRTAITPDDGDPRHGTVNGYSNLRCRCQPCRDAWAAWFKASRDRRAARITPDDSRHGLAGTYANHGCRCDRCRAANTVAKRLHRTQGRDDAA